MWLRTIFFCERRNAFGSIERMLTFSAAAAGALAAATALTPGSAGSSPSSSQSSQSSAILFSFKGSQKKSFSARLSEGRRRERESEREREREKEREEGSAVNSRKRTLGF